jgi:hypothetical protein
MEQILNQAKIIGLLKTGTCNNFKQYISYIVAISFIGGGK